MSTANAAGAQMSRPSGHRAPTPVTYRHHDTPRGARPALYAPARTPRGV